MASLPLFHTSRTKKKKVNTIHLLLASVPKRQIQPHRPATRNHTSLDVYTCSFLLQPCIGYSPLFFFGSCPAAHRRIVVAALARTRE